MPSVYLLFGEMGAGKSFYAKQIADKLDAAWVEGDLYVPAEMSRRIRRLLPPKREHIEGLVDELMDVPTRKFDKGYENVVISQALYSDFDRKTMIIFWENLG